MGEFIQFPRQEPGRKWSPAEILAIDIPAENRPIVGSPNHELKRKSPAELKTENQKRTAIARQAKAEKRKLKTMTIPYQPVRGGYPDNFPNFDDDNLDKQIEAIAEADGNIIQQIAILTHGSNWHEKMALATNAIVAIDDSHAQLCVVQPKHGRYNENLAAAIGLLRHLSPGAKAELAVDILSDNWELGAAEDAPSTLIE